jgi:cytoskeletal protein RodZ
VHDDRTRVMGQPEHPGGRPNGNVRLLVAGLIAVIVGLVIAVVVIADSDDGGDATSIPTQATSPPTSEEETTTEETTSEETTTEETETTESTATSPTTTTETTTTDEDDSGGIEAP